MTTQKMIEVMQAYINGECIEGTPKDANEWCELDEPYWDWNKCEYRVKAKPLTREEITAQWVRDNDLKEGDYVKNECNVILMYFGIQGDRLLLGKPDGLYKDYYSIEGLKKVNSKIVPFTFEYRELFRGKWVRSKEGSFSCTEFLITSIGDEKIKVGSDFYTYEEALEILEFIDGKPFGREVWS